ncbi:uncharacterized protein [Panulirus ornatus]|uniref:uncharacterized protein n=1 Tax=Panulirus ornatus TaxID=150431 RepID=UPI003A85A422
MEGRLLSPVEKTIRKIRKKLRQIEHLNLVDRDLNEEELSKVKQKTNLRKELRRLLEEHHPDETDVMKRMGAHLNKKESDVKKARSVATSTLKEEFTEAESQEIDLLNSTSGTEQKQKENLNSASSAYISPPNPVTIPTGPASVSSQIESHTDQDIFVASDITVETSTSETQQKYSVIGSPQQVQAQPQNLKKNCKESYLDETEKRKKSRWKESSYEVFILEGHNDIILSVDCMADFVLSASRDTTVRVWRVGNTVEERSLRGHTSAVTSVSFLPVSIATAVLAKFEADYDELPSFQRRILSDSSVLAVSGGLDCTLKIWDILSGKELGSVYTYNGITCIRCGTWGVVTGTEGGKLEVWCVASGQRLAFVNAFQNQVTGLCIEVDKIYAGSADGELGIWRFNTATKALRVVFIMEPGSSSYVPLRHLATLVTCNGKCYLGDSGPNVKILDWRKGHVSRLVNHVGDIGMTDSLAISSDGCLLAASYFVDSGCPSINVRDVSGDRYICTLIDKDEGRFLTMSTSPGIIVTGGHLLKVWVQMDKGKPAKKGKKMAGEIIRPNVLHKMSRSAFDSASEDDTDWASSSDDEDVQQLMSVRRGSSQSKDEEENGGWWCRIL